MNEGRILIVDDEPDTCDTLCDILKDEGYQPIAVQSAEDALEELKRKIFDIIIADIRLPEMDGIELLKETRKINPEMLSMIITGYPSMESSIEAMKAGAYDYITKPLSLDAIKLTIKRGMERQRLVAAHKELLQGLKKASHGLETQRRSLLNLLLRIPATKREVPATRKECQIALERISEASNKYEKLVNELLTFSRLTKTHKKPSK